MISPSAHFTGLEVTFNTTEDCNLACKYCYEINKRPKTLEFNDAKKFIDLLLEDPDPIMAKGTSSEWLLSTGLIMDFIGGDALINVDLIRRILEYFQITAWKKNHPWATRWRASLSTNGTLFDHPGVKPFMEDYVKNLSIGVSLDGCPEIHDANRIFKDGRGSMSEILKNWGYYTDWCQRAGIALSTKATLNKDSIPYLEKSIKYLFEDMGIHYINMNFIMEDTHATPEDISLLDEQLCRVKDYVLAHRHELYLSLFDSQMSAGRAMTLADRSTTRCGSGCMPALGINGKIYPCFRYLPHTVQSDKSDFNVGDVQSGFSLKERFVEVRNASRYIISDEECRSCPIESMCPFCIGGCYAEFGEFRRTKYICELAKKQDKYAKLYWREFDALENTRTPTAYTPTFEEYMSRSQ